MTVRHLALAAALAVATGGAAFADYPEKPITMIVPWPAGGTTDVIARLVAEPWGEALGQPVAVVNRTGGGGSLGTQAALDAPADGYTVLMTTSGNHILTPLKNPEVGYRYDDFDPVGQLASRTMVLVVRDDAPWQTLGEFVADAKDNPGSYLFGSVPAVLPFLVMDELAREAEIELVHVPQQGDAPGATALLGGDIDLLPASLSSVAGNIEGGTMRPLAVFNEERDPAFPDIPTAKEQGYDVVGNPFTGPAVAAGVPEEALGKLRETFAEVAADPAFRDQASKAGVNVEYQDAEAFGEIWARDWTTYEPVLRP